MELNEQIKKYRTEKNVSPAMVGSLSEMSGGNLKTGLLIATVFPVALVLGLLILKKKFSKALRSSV